MNYLDVKNQQESPSWYHFFLFQFSNPLSNETILYSGNVVSTDISKEEVKNTALSFEMSDAAIIRMIVNNAIRCEVSVRTVEESPPKFLGCLQKFFSSKWKRNWNCITLYIYAT
jgi:hypothetical protein